MGCPKSSKQSMVTPVARSELGSKRTCPVTGRKFYDLNKDPIVSPYTGQIVPIAAISNVGSTRGRAAANAADTRADEGEELVDPEAGDVELVSLEDADDDAAPAKKAPAGDEDVDGDDEDIGGDDDAAFIEDDEDSDDDVSDLIDGDISDDEEA